MDAQTQKTVETIEEKDAKWNAAMVYLKEMTEKGQLTTQQYDVFCTCWQECRRRCPMLRYPNVSTNEDGDELRTNWWFIGIDIYQELVIFQDGTVEWYYYDMTKNAPSEGSDEREASVPEAFYAHLDVFAEVLYAPSP